MKSATNQTIGDALRQLDALVARIPREAYFDAGTTNHNVYVLWFDGSIPRYVGIRRQSKAPLQSLYTSSFMSDKDDYFIKHKDTLWLASTAGMITTSPGPQTRFSMPSGSILPLSIQTIRSLA
jgi:hypothetical protein